MLLSLLLAVQAPVNIENPDDFEMVNSITIRTAKLSNRDISIAQRYASCVSMPYVPLEAERDAKFAKCRKAKLQRSKAPLKEMLDHIDHIVTENPGSEASLYVKRDNAANP
jgi:hypothetical protein